MANGSYIGKISALVTASTSDLSRKLRDGAKDVDRFSNSVRAQFDRASRSAENSLNQIFTPLQRLQRALTAGRSSTLNILTEDQVRRLQQSVSLAEQINKPLASAARAFQNLSADAAIAFAPALVRAQEAAIQLSNTLAETGQVGTTQFNQAQRAVERTAEAIQRLNSLQRASAAGLTGNEAQFVNPRALEEINAAAAASQRVGALPASQREDPGLRERVRQLAQFRQQIVETAAQVESLELSPDVDQTALESARRRLEQIIETTRRARLELENLPATTRGFTLAGAAPQRQGLGLFGAQSGNEAQRAVQQARELDAEFKKLPASAQAGIGSLAGIADRLASEVAETGSGTENLNAVLAVLAQRIAAAAAEASEFSRISAAADAAAARITSLAAATEQALGTASPTVDSLEKEFRELLATISRTAGSQAGSFEPLTREILELFAAAVGGADNLDQLAQKIERLRVQSAGGRLNILQGFDADAERAQRALDEVAQSRNSIADRLLSAGGGQGVAGLNLGIDEREIRAVGGEIQFLQDRLSTLTDDLRGPSVAALQRYRQVVSDTFRRGAQNTDQGREAIARARREVVALAADVLRVKPTRLGEQLKRAGDVGRAGFGNLSLGIQQAAFAIDDFFSVSGGLDQRIRAAGNNISQLGFVLGGTAGLIAGISVSIGAQLVAGLINVASGSTDARDSAKALNDALAEQKRLADEVTQSFDQLIGSALQSSFDRTLSRFERLNEQLEELAEKIDQLSTARLSDLDPAVVFERVRQAQLNRRLLEATSVGEVIAIQRELEASQRREQAAAAAATQRPAPTAAEVEANLSGGVDVLEQLRRNERLFANAGIPLAVGVRALRAAPDAVERVFGEDAARTFTELTGVRSNAAQQQTIDVLNQSLADFQAAGNDQERLDALNRAADELSNAIASSGLLDTPQRLAFQNILEEVQRQIASIADPEVRRANEIFIQATKTASEASQIIADSRERLSEEFGDFGSFIADDLARAQESLEETAQRLSSARERGDADRVAALQAEINAQRAVVDALASAERSTIRFAGVLERLSNSLARVVASESQAAALSARRAANRARGLADEGLGLPEDAGFAQRQRERSEQAARQSQIEQQRVEAQNRLERDLFERRARAGQIDPETRDLLEERDRLQQEFEEAQANGDRARARGALERRIRIDQELDRRFEDSAEGRRASARADRFDQREAARQAAIEQIARGRSLGQTPAEQAARQLQQDLSDLSAAFDDTVEGILDSAGGRPDAARAELDAARADFEADRQRLVDERLRQQAPGIFGLADEVANAIVSGPSRAALQATDVSTVEGSRELNRLIRGDDSARDQNIVELQRQSAILERIARGVEEPAPVAN